MSYRVPVSPPETSISVEPSRNPKLFRIEMIRTIETLCALKVPVNSVTLALLVYSMYLKT